MEVIYLFENSIKKEDAVAFFRFSVISPMLNSPKGQIDATAKKLAQTEFNDLVNQRMVTFHYRTIYTYYMNYKKHGFEGLKPKRYKNKGKHPSVPDQYIKDILNLKEELPSRSARKIITMLELAKKIEDDSLQVRTVNRILNHYGYTTKSLKNSSRVYQKHEKNQINKMWQSDVMSAFYIPDKNGKKRICYLIGFIDDHSRRVTHAQFYFDATLTRLEDSLKKAVIKFGAPDALYVDNGKIYISNDFKLICARLGIIVKYSKPYQPSGKGKVEKFWQYVQSSFLTEIRNNKVSSIIELNDLFAAWLKTEYNDKLHSSLGTTPTERWMSSLKSGRRLRYFSPVQLDQAFMHFAERTVSKYGVISFNGNQYAIDGRLVNKKIAIRYNPFHLDSVHIYYQDKYYGLARIIDLKEEKHKSVAGIEEDPVVDSAISREYLKNIKSNYQDYLKKQLNSPLEEKVKLQAKAEDSEEKTAAEVDTAGRIVPDEKVQALKRQEFVDIISTALGIKNLSYAEKGKLYELWQTFKEFNRELLIDIVDDIRDKTPDFNDNFLYYLAQIKNIYLEKSKEDLNYDRY